MPNTVNRFLNIPNTGDLVGAWGTTAVNNNFSLIDGALGGVVSISLSVATTFTLTIATSATFTPGTGPSQSDNALIKFSGTLTGNAICKFTMPGYYIVQNNCGSAMSFSIKLSPSSGGGKSIGAPPGRKTHVFFDGTDMDYVDMPEVGAAMDLHTFTTAYPVWMNVCDVRPWLIKDGSVYNVSSYTALAQVLGSTFGGNGSSTFGVPDERARARIALDTLSINTGTYAGRLTNAGSGVIGTTMGASGGSEFMPNHAHTATVTDPGHRHNYTTSITGLAAAAGGGVALNLSGETTFTTSSDTTGITAAVNATGSGSSGNVMPVVVSFLPLIKT